MTFKDVMANDVKNVFFCDDLFSEQHEWNGEYVRCIIDDNEMIKRYKDFSGAFPTNAMLVLVPTSEFKQRIPDINDGIKFDNVYYSIQDIKDEDGVLAILLVVGGYR